MRAHDLLRYRNFRTLTTPSPTQLLSLAVDPSGEVVCAGGGQEPFEVGQWVGGLFWLVCMDGGEGMWCVDVDGWPSLSLL